jgi:hypothetical protein
MPYVRTTWADNPSTSSPVDAANLNNMEVELVSLDTHALRDDGSVDAAPTASTGQTIKRTLGGAAKTVLTLKATDGKEFAFIITTAGSLQIKNVTDGVVLLELGPAAGTIFASDAGTASKVFHTANDGDGSGLDADTIGGRKVRVSTSDPGLATGGAWIKDS